MVRKETTIRLRTADIERAKWHQEQRQKSLEILEERLKAAKLDADTIAEKLGNREKNVTLREDRLEMQKRGLIVTKEHLASYAKDFEALVRATSDSYHQLKAELCKDTKAVTAMLDEATCFEGQSNKLVNEARRLVKETRHLIEATGTREGSNDTCQHQSTLTEIKCSLEDLLAKQKELDECGKSLELHIARQADREKKLEETEQTLSDQVNATNETLCTSREVLADLRESLTNSASRLAEDVDIIRDAHEKSTREGDRIMAKLDSTLEAFEILGTRMNSLSILPSDSDSGGPKRTALDGIPPSRQRPIKKQRWNRSNDTQGTWNNDDEIGLHTWSPDARKKVTAFTSQL